MAEDPDEIVVGANGQLYLAPVSTAAPATPTAAPAGTWIELGLLTDDGVKKTYSKTINDIRSWQRFYPTRKIVSEANLMIGFAMQQWNAHNFQFAFGGGSIAETGVDSGIWKWTPPPPEEIDEHALLVRWQDGDKNYQLWLPRGMSQENVETDLLRTAEARLPIVFGIIGSDTGNPYELITDDPAFEVA